MLGLAVKGVLITPPAEPAQVRQGEFNTGRAIGRLERILGDQRPHPIDTGANDAVRERLIRELRAIGLQPEVHEAADCATMPHTRVVRCARVRNVVASIRGRTAGPQLLLDAHYDSTPAGPGAGDDGIGVATLLEVASILKTGAPPPHSVTFLFNEGEEYGLNGSSAFVHSDPLAKPVGSVINIDARGVSGPATMFETSEPNGPAIAIFARAGGWPFANSISTDFAKLIPNTTDAVQFKPMGWTLLNYAIIGNETRYHTPGDTVGALSRATVAHMGGQVLAAARTMFANPDAPRAGTGRTVFTDVAGRALVRLPLAVAGTLLGLLLLASIYLAWREKALGRPLLAAAATLLAGCVTAAAISIAAESIRPGDFWRGHPLVAYMAIYAALLGAMAAVWNISGKQDREVPCRAAAWLLILGLGSAASLLLPGATIFFLFGPALALTGIAVVRRAPGLANVLAIAAILIQFLLFAELLALIETLLVDGPLWAVAPLAAVAALPAFAELKAGQLRPAAALMALAAVALWGTALMLPRSSAERLASFTIDYFRDADRNEASWAIATKQAPLPANFPGRWSKGVLPYNARTRWLAPAPALASPVPAMHVVSDERSGSGRRIRFLLDSGGADSVSIRFAARTKLVAMGLPGHPIAIPATGAPDKALLGCSGRSCASLVLEALLAAPAPIHAELFATRSTLPMEAKPLVAARPSQSVPQYSSDQTVTMKRISF